MTLTIPKQPDKLSLRVDHLWNGDVCPDDRVFAVFDLSTVSEGINVRAESPVLLDQSIPPEIPIGNRVEGLWNFDVVELFLVGPGHQYLEIELGAGGHFLILGFDRIRHRSNEYINFHPVLSFRKTSEKTWVSEFTIPWKMIPENLRALNAFMIASGQFLAYSPLPGDKPDFHQPDFYPYVTSH
ncbi:hypothetical protein HY771_00975 [Candidatus Uhrbacteria bacterium]|nr:hypothetical protein [Candidatus Uhrbacteria bacterium]